MIKTPLRYPGGKSKVADYLVELFPDYKEYREPFLGGGSVFLTAMQKNPDAQFVVNDLYYDLFCFWSCMMDRPKEVLGRVFTLKNSYKDGRELYNFLISDLPRMRRSDAYGVAAYFFLLNRITFSGTSLSGGYSDESFRKRLTESSIERLTDCGEFLKSIDTGGFVGDDYTGKKGIITNNDFSVTLTQQTAGILEKSVDDGDVFVFLDPPYYTAEDSGLYGENGDLHKGFDHIRLKECLDDCNFRIMMTYDDCEYIRTLYKGYYIMPLEFTYGMRNVTSSADMKGKEIIISNYKIQDNSKSIQLF